MLLKGVKNHAYIQCVIETYNRYILWCDGAGGVGHGEVAASWS